MDVPAVTPVTVPDEPTVALPLPELHTPPPVPSLRVVARPAHTLSVPVMAAGVGFTVIVWVADALPQLSERE